MKTNFIKKIHLINLVLLSYLVMSVSVRAQELVGWWKLDEGSGMVAMDLSGKGNDGIVNNPTGGLGINGDMWVNDPERGMVASFNGASNIGAFIRCGTGNIIPAMTLTNDFTWAFWAKQAPSNTSNNAVIIGNRSGGTQNPIQFIKFTPLQFEYYRDGQIGGPQGGEAVPQGAAEEAAINYKDVTAAEGWIHNAVVKEGSSLKYYRNGLLTITATVTEGIDSNPFFIGGDGPANENWAGYISDVRLWNNALTETEIRMVADSIDLDPLLQSIFNTIEEAQTNINEKMYQQTISLIEEKISEYEQTKQKSPEKITSAYDSYICELYYLLAVAKEAVGKPKGEIVVAYKQSLQSDTISNKSLMQKQGSTLLWLLQNSNSDYKTEVNALLNRNTNYLRAVAAKSETMISEQEDSTAIKYLEDSIASYKQWQEEHPYDEVIAEDVLPEIYFQLAKAKESTKAPIMEIAEAYSETFVPSNYNYVPERAEALIWLIENKRTEELTRAIKSFTQEKEIKTGFKNIVSDVYKHFELKKDGYGFQLLLNTLFTTAQYPSDWAVFVESCIADKTSRWAQIYYSILEDKPRLKFGVDCVLAAQYVAEEKYKEAAELYESVISRCEAEDDKAEMEFQLCKCLFDGGMNTEAIAKIDSFINNYKSTHRSRIKEVMLMRGRTLIQIGDVDKAIDAFTSVIIEYPETQELPETTFFVGYCYMLQGKFEQATEAFEIISKSYPDSSYANEAKMCLMRIKEMTD